MTGLTMVAAAMTAAMLNSVRCASIAKGPESASVEQAAELKQRLSASNGVLNIWDRDLVPSARGGSWGDRFDWERRTKFEYNRATSVAGPEMVSKRLATTLALALVLVAAASAKGVHEPERLNADVDKHAADDFINPISVVSPVVGLAKGIIAAIIISVIIVVVLIIVCCVCMCRACAGKKETHTVVYTGHPNQQMPQQFPPQMHQQWPPGAQPTSPPHEYRGPTEPSSQPQAYSAPPPAYPPGPAYVPPNKY
ncbi:uncharacterized protein LOC119434056 isoform X2 [Dermacentor silvarum]|nr:uncharacterized protein LOC119434056 isoform X2 [Dermacentor silvarum]